MMTSFLADLVLVLHLLFIAFAVGGGLLALCWRWVPLLHLPALAWGATVEFTGWMCPLTPLENALRHAAGVQGYAGSFIGHYLLPLIYPGELTREWQWWLGALLMALNAAVYALLWRRRKRWQHP